MNMTNTVHAVLGLGLVLAAAAASGGTLIVGSFEGIATGSHVYSADGNQASFDGEVVSGNFSIDTSVHVRYTTLEPGYSWNVISPLAIGMTVYAHGQTVTYGNAAPYGAFSFLSLSAADIPMVSISVDGGDPYHNAYVNLAGALFDTLDVESLHAGPVDLSHSSVGFMGGRLFGSGIALTSLTLTSPVPELKTTWLMALGLAGLALAALRRRATTAKTNRCPDSALEVGCQRPPLYSGSSLGKVCASEFAESRSSQADSPRSQLKVHELGEDHKPSAVNFPPVPQRAS